MEISAYTTCFNNRDTLAEVIQSVRQQTMQVGEIPMRPDCSRVVVPPTGLHDCDWNYRPMNFGNLGRIAVNDVVVANRRRLTGKSA